MFLQIVQLRPKHSQTSNPTDGNPVSRQVAAPEGQLVDRAGGAVCSTHPATRMPTETDLEVRASCAIDLAEPKRSAEYPVFGGLGSSGRISHHDMRKAPVF